MDNIFYMVVLSDMPDDIEIIGGPRESVIHLITQIARNKKTTIKKITQNEATNLIKDDGCIGCGCFIKNRYNIVDNENRRLLSKDLLIYIGTRTGFTIMWEPVELSTDREPDKMTIASAIPHLNRYYNRN